MSTLYTYAADGTIATTTKPAPGDNYVVQARTLSPRSATPRATRSTSELYTDPRGVTHTYTSTTTVSSTARATRPTGSRTPCKMSKPTELGGQGDLEQGFSPKRNTRLERVAYTTLNGLATGLEITYDSGGASSTRARPTRPSCPFSTHLRYDANGRVSSYKPGPGTTSSTSPGMRRETRRAFRRTNRSPIRQTLYTWNGPNGQADTITQHGVTTTITFDTATGNPSHTVDTMGRVSRHVRCGGQRCFVFDGQTTQTFGYEQQPADDATDADGNATISATPSRAVDAAEKSLVTSIHTPDLAGQGVDDDATEPKVGWRR